MTSCFPSPNVQMSSTLMITACCRQRNQVPVIYYTNLLISSLIQSCSEILWFRISSKIYYYVLCLLCCRYFSIVYPLLDSMTQTKSSVLVCVLVWAFCIVSVPLAVVLKEFVRLIIYALLPAPLFIFCLAPTLGALPAATSVPTEEQLRSLGTLILLFFNYFLIILPTIICHLLDIHLYMFLILFLLCPDVDMILIFFMRKGRIDKLLACLYCFSMENATSDVAADSQCDSW
uniref:G-protein coupled receptors family 1 profile domain-containing protein n=1 Tax=Amphilophus citrinellus TaxID=61819 RepID=A0A3Q0S9Y7_AMPCI